MTCDVLRPTITTIITIIKSLFYLQRLALDCVIVLRVKDDQIGGGGGSLAEALGLEGNVRVTCDV